MTYTTLPSPIAYCRHLVDTEDDERARIDQLRVLIQNTFQLLAAILVNDCAENGIAGTLPSLPQSKRLAIGDFVSLTYEASTALMSVVDRSFVPELVELYGAPGTQTRRRRQRGQRFAAIRNEDVHTASLAQTSAMLTELSPRVEEFLQELQFLEGYPMVAVNSLEVSPDKKRVTIHGRRCHGTAQKYAMISMEGSQYPSRGEVILAQYGKSYWLSLRPWFLFSYEIGYLNQGVQELLLLNEIAPGRLRYVGLMSGDTYRFETDEWLTDTVFTAGEGEVTPIVLEPTLKPAVETTPVKPKGVASVEAQAVTFVSSETQQQVLDALHGISSLTLRPTEAGEVWILVQTPIRDVPVGILDVSGSLWLHIESLRRAVSDGLLTKEDLSAKLAAISKTSSLITSEITLPADMMQKGGIKWLVDLLGRFKHPSFNNGK